MKVRTLLKKVKIMPYAMTYTTVHLDYDGMTAYFYILDGYENETDAYYAFRKQINKLQKQHLDGKGSTDSFINDTNSDKGKKKGSIEYIYSNGWVTEDGTGYNKIRAKVSIIKKKVGEELVPEMFKDIGPFGLDDYDIENFFSKEEVSEPM